ncbi:hypothetical protein [Flavobacterium sp.]|uniref:hypothetical protein n=1 Tax=Flavobacterium sp. TaxID=239 RepID=UPI002636B06E|nr:hypothetical protein [Flavobacterium sp.]
MRKIECSCCGNKDLPINESITVDQQFFCSSCFESNFSEEGSLEKRLVEKEHDPTICSSCNKDFGDVELQKIAVYPHCDECHAQIKNRTFPNWVKGFFAGIIIILIVSFCWNWKYYQAYKDIQTSNTFSEQGDYANATLSMQAASKAVPEVEELETLAAYYKGIDLLTKDKSAQAIIEFNKCVDKLPYDYKVNSLIVQGKINVCFDKKDYEGFLSASKENLAIDSTSASSWTSVASAYACIYAQKGNNDAKLQVDKYIKKAKQIDSTSEDMKVYYNMIDYRIFSRKIIVREDFIKQFPKGWTKN